MYPRASPHAENEELENSIRARGTRAGTICEFMVQYGQMKHLASITALILPACVYAESMVVPSLPDSLRPRAEAETNVTFLRLRGPMCGCLSIREINAWTGLRCQSFLLHGELEVA